MLVTSGEVDFEIVKAEVGESRVVKLAGELAMSKADEAPGLVLGKEQVRLEFPLERILSFTGRLITGGESLGMAGPISVPVCPRGPECEKRAHSHGKGESTQYTLRFIP